MADAAAAIAACPYEVALSFGSLQARIGRALYLEDRALELRNAVFAGSRLSDRDRFDDCSLHGIVTEADRTLAAFRVRVFAEARDLSDSYTAQFYDLSPLREVSGSVLELGRLCHAPNQLRPPALRAAWAALTALADAQNVSLLIGCSSFAGSDPRDHSAALATLRAFHVGPASLCPKRKSTAAVDLPGPGMPRGPVPALLRSYLAMGGWVGDHAVRDTELDTVHVFTGLHVADIPETRKIRLRALANTGARSEALDVTPAAP